MEQTPTAARPMGITILAVLAGIAGVLGLLGALALLGLGGVAGASGAGTYVGLATVSAPPIRRVAIRFVGLVILVLSVLELAFAYGAWMLKAWAWVLGVASQVVSIAWSVIAAVTGNGFNIIGIAIAAAILYYLFTPDVKRAFGRP